MDGSEKAILRTTKKKPRGMRGASEEGVIDAFDSGKLPKQPACY